MRGSLIGAALGMAIREVYRATVAERGDRPGAGSGGYAGSGEEVNGDSADPPGGRGVRTTADNHQPMTEPPGRP
jgi:hypothetical protein